MSPSKHSTASYQSTSASLEATDCGLCGEVDWRYLYPALTRQSPFNMAQCRRCDLIQRIPRSPTETLTEYYRNQYHGGKDDPSIERGRIPMFKLYLQRIQKYCVKGSILDIGCGTAGFLKWAHDSGFDVCGLDVSETAVRQALSILPDRILRCTVQEARLPSGHFDVATMFNVLDHLTDPLQAAQKAYTLLKPGGLLLVRVPNGTIHHAFKKAVDRLAELTRYPPTTDLGLSPFNMYQFTPATLGRLFKKAGFTRMQFVNSPTSRGNPTGRTRVLPLYVILSARACISGLAWFVDLMSRGRWLLGSSFDGYAFKDD